MSDRPDRAERIADNYINGNIADARRLILTGRKPAHLVLEVIEVLADGGEDYARVVRQMERLLR